METYNITATGYINGTIKTKNHKSNGYALLIDKRQSEKGQFDVYWGPGCTIPGR
jgi:hypothetical protein